MRHVLIGPLLVVALCAGGGFAQAGAPARGQRARARRAKANIAPAKLAKRRRPAAETSASPLGARLIERTQAATQATLQMGRGIGVTRAEHARRERALKRAAVRTARNERRPTSPAAAEAVIKKIEKSTEPESAKALARVSARVASAGRSAVARSPRAVRRVAHRIADIGRATGRRLRVSLLHVSARMTIGVDALVVHTPSALRPVLTRARDFNPVHVVAFLAERVRRDPVFLAGFVVGANVVSQLTTPAMLMLGFSMPVAIAARYWTKPFELAALVVREQHLRRKADPTLTSTQVIGQLVSEYRVRAESRRQRARDYMAEYRRGR